MHNGGATREAVGWVLPQHKHKKGQQDTKKTQRREANVAQGARAPLPPQTLLLWRRQCTDRRQYLLASSIEVDHRAKPITAG